LALIISFFIAIFCSDKVFADSDTLSFVLANSPLSWLLWSCIWNDIFCSWFEIWSDKKDTDSFVSEWPSTTDCSILVNCFPIVAFWSVIWEDSSAETSFIPVLRFNISRLFSNEIFSIFDNPDITAMCLLSSGSGSLYFSRSSSNVVFIVSRCAKEKFP